MAEEQGRPGDSELDPPPELMRAMGYAVVDLLVERLTTLESRPAWRGASRAEMRERLAGAGPEQATPFPDLLAELREHVLPFAGAIDHPRFFAFVPSSPTWPAILGDFLAAGFNVFQGTWIESAGPSAVELEVLGWFKDWVGYPAESAGLLTSGGSAANLTALVTARTHLLGHDWADAVLYTTAETHSSVARAARILGFREDRVRRLGTDDRFRISPPALAAAIAADRMAGLRPFLVVANGGSTSTGAVDPLEELADLCGREGLWLHVDAAYGGFAVLIDRGRSLLEGLGRADSITLDPHKWLFQPYEAGCLLVREGVTLVDAFRIMPDYLQDTRLREEQAPDDAEVNFADRGPQLTRSFRALKIWLSLRYSGLAPIRRAIDLGLDLAARAEVRIRASDQLELMAPASLGVVCFRSRDGEAADALRVARLSDSGVGMISSTRIRGQYALRLCILNHRSRWADVERVIVELERPPQS